MYTCTHCQTIFKPLRTNKNKPRKFCSTKCRGEYSKTTTITKCLHCGKDTPNPKFCNSSCAASYNNRISPKKQKTYNTCPTCGTQHRRPVYCSDACNPKRLNLTPEQKLLRHRAIHNEAWHRYMARLKNQTPGDVNVRELQDIYLNRPEGHEVDHIHPVSKGGLHSPENLQYLPKTENRKKSNKLNWRAR